MWAFHCYDAATGTATGTVAMASWEHTSVLNDAGSWSARLAPPQTVVLAEATLAATVEGRSVILPIRDGDTLDGFAGWVPPGGRRRPDLAGGGLLSYFDRRYLTADNIGGSTLTYAAVDQFSLAADLIYRSQFGPTGIFIDVGAVGTSGVLRDQTWYSWEAKNIGEAIRQKSALIDGFDFDIRVEVDFGVPVRRLRCWYPRRGRTTGGPVFTVGGNVIGVPDIGGNEQFRTATYASGAETGDVITVGDSENRVRLTHRTVAQTLLDAGYPIIEEPLNLPDIRTASVLADHTEGYLIQHGHEHSGELVLDVNPNDVTWPYGSWEIGDDCRVVIPSGLSVWWPSGKNETRRVVAHRWRYGPDGERLQVVTGLPFSGAM